jgi:hypothetical protein|tara:strand:- start:44 stop:388 length:345 start_codon:yes stop_codon:yes gene_type:complete
MSYKIFNQFGNVTELTKRNKNIAIRQHQKQNKKEIMKVYFDVEKQVKYKDRSVVTSADLMTKQGELYSPDRVSHNDYCKFKRGLQYRDVVLCDGTIINIPVPVTSGSGSRGSKF